MRTGRGCKGNLERARDEVGVGLNAALGKYFCEVTQGGINLGRSNVILSRGQNSDVKAGAGR